MKRLLLILAATTALTSSTVLAQTESNAQQQPALEQSAASTMVSDVRNQTVYLGNEEAGRIGNVIIDGEGKHYLIVTLGSAYGGQEAPIPVENFTRENNRLMIAGLTDAQLRQIAPYQQSPAFRPLEDSDVLAIRMLPSAGMDQQTMVQADANAPQVTIQQATPQVNVTQAQPEIIVRQAPPTITVDMPQPEIIVRMPQANVDVSLAKPEVQVKMPDPQVTVTPPQSTGEVTVERGQPKVTFERLGQPKIVFNQTPGEPNVQIEETGGAQQSAATNTENAGQQLSTTAQTPAVTPDAAITAANEPALADGGEVTGTIGAADARTVRALNLTELEGKNVYNLRGDNLGEISDVLLTSGNKPFFVVEYGGFLGLGERRVVLPADSFGWRDNRLVIAGMSEDQLRQQPAWDSNAPGYTPADSNFLTDLNVVE